MTRGEIYVKLATLTSKSVQETLSTFNTLRWKNNCKVLDIGCGPGNVTHDVLFPMLPQPGTVIGIDKCETFIDHANSHYQNQIISFKLMDIVHDQVPEEYKQFFDYVVSFYCFHQFNDHRAVFGNIKQMLKPGGEALLYFPSTTRVFSVYEVISKQEKWKPYFTDYELYCSPYKNSVNVQKDIEMFLDTMGFQILSLNFEEKKSKFACKDIPNLVEVLIPIPIPNNLKSEFAAECIRVSRDLGFMRFDESNDEYMDFRYNLVLLHITKEL